MRKRSENPRKNIDIDKLEEFADGARGGGAIVEKSAGKKPKKKKKKELDRFHMAIDPAIKEAIQALAWYDRVSQREIVEEAFLKVFPLKSDQVTEALEKYRNQNS